MTIICSVHNCPPGECWEQHNPQAADNRRRQEYELRCRTPRHGVWQDENTQFWHATCEPCDWQLSEVMVSYATRVVPDQLWERHTETRGHRAVMASPTRLAGPNQRRIGKSTSPRR